MGDLQPPPIPSSEASGGPPSSPTPPSPAGPGPGGRAVPGGEGPDPERTSRPPHRAPPAVAIVAAVAVVLGGVGLTLTIAHRGGDPAGGHGSRPGAPGSAPGYRSIAEFAPIAAGYVEQRRGLRFKRPVPVTLLDDVAFRKKLLGDRRQGQASGGSVETAAKELRALHLISGDLDLGRATDALLGAGVSGFYDTKARSLVVRGVRPTPYVRQVIVHELTHALQDQWFGLDRPQLDAAEDERADAFKALVEGDAVDVENQYHASLSAAERDEADRESAAQGGSIPSSVPRVLLELLSFPYQAGPRFVEALRARGGEGEVDAAFRHPPTTSAQVLDPDLYLGGREAIPVSTPEADGAVFDRGVLGEFGLLVILEPLVESGRLAEGRAAEAARAWGGDRYVAYDRGRLACVRVTLVAGSADGQIVLDDALRSFSDATPGTTGPAAGAGPATLTACG